MMLLVIGLLQAKLPENKFYLYENSSTNSVELKWFSDKYESDYNYKVYRAIYGQELQLIKELKAKSVTYLKDKGYSEDYIFMIYPYGEVKSFQDRVQVLKIEKNVQGFRLLKTIRDNTLAKNMGQYYRDTKIKKDKVYVYKVEAYRQGKKIFSKSVLAHTFKRQAKNDFLWVKAKGTADSIDLRWDVQEAYNYYNVYRKLPNEKMFRKINKNILFISRHYAQKAKLLYSDKKIGVAKEAHYYVRRINMFGEEGQPSKEMVARRIAQNKVPHKVKNFFIKADDKKMTLRWKATVGALSYNVYRSTISQGNFVKINKKPVKQEVYFDRDFKTDQNYYYYVTALNTYGESLPSVFMLGFSRDVSAPKRPIKLIAKVEAGKVHLNWVKSKDTDVIGYRVYLSMDEDMEQWSMVTSDVIKENSFTHTRPKKLSRFPYYYRVSAVDKSKNESERSKIVKIQLPDVTSPKQPFVTKHRAYASKIVLEWNKIYVYDFSHYNVYKKRGKTLVQLNTKALHSTTFTDIKPYSGINEYVITAIDNSGNESNTSKSTTVLGVDNTPVQIKDFKLKKTKEGVAVTFSCDDKDFSGFKLFRSSGKSLKYYNVSNFVKGKKFVDKTVANNTSYFYMIKAYDNEGNIVESNVLKFKNVQKEKK